MTAIVLTGGIDLSIGSIIALASVSFGLLWQRGWPLEWAAAATLAVGAAAGAGNAALVVLRVAPLVATLATMSLYAGLAMALSHGQRVAGLPETFTRWGQGSWLGMPNQLPLFLGVWLAAWVAVHHSRFGRYLFAIGENPLAAEFAAVPVKRVQSTLYIASGLTARARGLVLHGAGAPPCPGPVRASSCKRSLVSSSAARALPAERAAWAARCWASPHFRCWISACNSSRARYICPGATCLGR